MSACTDANVDLWYQQAFSLDDKLRTSNAPPRAFTSEAYGLERAPACSSSTINLSREESAKYADVLLVGSADGALVYLDTKNYVQARKRVDAYFQTARFAKPTMEAGWDVPSRARQLAPIMQRINALLAAKGYPPKPYIPDRA